MKYNNNYHNNPLNWLLSIKTDKKRSIMDIDGFITKMGEPIGFLIDHKNNHDNITPNTLRQLSKFSDLMLKDNTIIKSFIVRCSIDEEKQEMMGPATIYEVKSFNDVKSKKERKDFIKNTYTLLDTIELMKFLSPESHIDIINEIKDRL